MTKLRQVYKCQICGNMVEVLHAGAGQLVCCGQPMSLLQEKMEDEGSEKHVPVLEKTAVGFKVKIGSVPHPMGKEHYIEWVELIIDDKVYHQWLNPGEPTEAEFCVQGEKVTAREYCNLHGLWQSFFA